jgi:hypothetical protein
MADPRRACLVYVAATQGNRAQVRAELEQAGFAVCEVLAAVDDARAAQAGAGDLPPALAACLRDAQLCVFLLPEDEKADGLIGAAAAEAQAGGKRIIGVVAGARERYPEALDDFARAMVRVGSGRLGEAVSGVEVWEAPGGGPIAKRDARNVKCQ